MLKIQCSKKTLMQAVINVQRAVSSKSTIAVLEGILLKTEKDTLLLCGYNLELGIKTSIDVFVEEHGTIVINAKLLSQIVRKLPKDRVIISVDDKNSVLIESGNAKFSIIGISPDEFPSLPELSDSYDLKISTKILKSMINQTIYAVSTNDIKPIYTGSLFEISSDEVKLVALDGCRLAIRKENVKIDNCNENKSFVVPGKTLSELVSLLDDKDEVVEIIVDRKYIVFKNSDYYILSRLINGVFMEYRNPIPKNDEIKTKIKVSVNSFIESIERVSLIISDNVKNPIRCFFDAENKIIKVSSMTGIGKANDETDAEVNGTSLEIGFNETYLIEALKHSDTDTVMLEIKDSTSPMKVIPVDGEDFLFLVLPVRLS